ncbi:tRNA-uridine aminocarboxypropyltransferase [Plasmodiophora brassicae]
MQPLRHHASLPLPAFSRPRPPTVAPGQAARTTRDYRHGADFTGQEPMPEDPSLRMGVLARRYYGMYCQFVAGAVDKHKCQRCWFLAQNCACEAMERVSGSVFAPHRVLLLMHFRELCRASNSGRILLAPPSNRCFVFGMQAQESALIGEINAFKGRSVILWPGPGSITFEELRREPGEQLQIIVLDGTWNNSRAMDRVLPRDIPRVRLSGSTRTEFGGTRKHKDKERVCTAGACLHALRELGAPPGQLQPLADAINVFFDTHSNQRRIDRLRE